MNQENEGLYSVCSAIFSSTSNATNRLKAILQIAFEFLQADSITAYRYDRVTQHLELTAMPGVLQREVMRGPTLEPVFQWEEEKLTPPQLPNSKWFENKSEYKEYITQLTNGRPSNNRRKSPNDFRRRQLSKYEENTDLSTAKICLYKGMGQTEDRVGMLFFNFPKFPNNTNPTFTPQLKSAIIYISTLIREILIEELYHTQKRGIDSGMLLRDALNMLRMTEDHASRLTPDIAHQRSLLSEEYHNILQMRKEALSSRCHSNYSKIPYKDIVEKHLEILNDLESNSNHCPEEDQLPELEVISSDVQLLKVCGDICRAALGTCETFGGQADIIFVLGGNVGRRIAPQDIAGFRENDYFWLNSKSITNYCLESGKVFALNNIRQKAHPEFQERLENEYGAQQYESLIVVPIFDVGPYRCVLRLMSSDRNCFLDHHTQAVQFTAFVAKHSLNMLLQTLMRKQTSQGMSFFAQGQTLGPKASTEDLLRQAMKVLGAEYAIFWCVPEKPKPLPFEACVWVPVYSDVKTQSYWLNTDADLVRPEGMTSSIYQYAKKKNKSDALFCVHILSDLQKKSNAFPDYSFEVYECDSNSTIANSDRLLESGWFGKKRKDNFPGIDKPIPLNMTTNTHPHTQIGLVVAQHGNPFVVRGVLWIGFDSLRDLNWWEKAYLRGLANYLAQGIATSGLVLSLRSFRHSIENLATLASPSTIDFSYPNAPAISKSVAENIKQAENDLNKARLGWEMISAKAREVKQMLSWSQPQMTNRDHHSLKPQSLQNALKGAWAIATDLRSRPDMFQTITPEENVRIEKCKDMYILYSEKINSDKEVSSGSVVYAVATVILHNSIIHGKKGPYIAWVISGQPNIQIIFGNGGNPPSEEDDVLLKPEAQMRFNTLDSGTGLWFARRLLRTEGGNISLLRKLSGESPGPIPSIVRKCKTFYEIILPKGD